jgi:hypothetical protein
MRVLLVTTSSRLTVHEFRRALAVRLGVAEVVFAGEAGEGAQQHRLRLFDPLVPTVKSYGSILSPATS